MTTFDSRLKKLVSLIPLPASTVIGRRSTGEEVAVTMAQLASDIGVIGAANSGAMSFETVLGTILTEDIIMPACTVTRMDSVVMGPTTDTAPETLTFSNETGAMTGGVITIATGAVAQEKDTATPTTNNVFALGERLSCAVGGENGQATLCRVTVFFTLT
jgi:hypothetical protein